MYKIAPSILSADFARLGQEISAVAEAGADYIHVDVMDGHFVPNITIGPPVVRSLRKITKLPLDVHLMISNPDTYIEAFQEAGADILTIHAEVATHLHRSLQHIRSKGMKASVSLNPASPLAPIEYVLENLDMVLIMSVNPGFGGQAFIPQVVPKIEKLKKMIDRQGLEIEIEVDGGVGPKNIGTVSAAGANVFVAGSAIFGTDDYAKTIQTMRDNIVPYT